MLKTAKGLVAIALCGGAISAFTHPATAAPIAPALTAESLESLQGLEVNASQPAYSLQDQVTSVSQLSDIKPTDWAFQALQSLVERYGCIVGYPDKTFRGNRAFGSLLSIPANRPHFDYSRSDCGA
jgi:hypothetical protein